MSAIPELHAFWDRPSPASTGDTDADKLFNTIGRALTTWEGIEENFCYILSTLTGSHSEAITRIYGSIISGPGRIDALQAAAEIFFNAVPEEKAASVALDLLLKHFRKAAGVRNEIGHGRVYRFTINNVNHGYFLIAPIYWTKKRKPELAFMKKQFEMKLEAVESLNINSAYRYTTSDLIGFINKFSLLNDWVVDYGNLIHPIRERLGWH